MEFRKCSKCGVTQAHVYDGFYTKSSGKIWKKYRDDLGRLWQNGQCNRCYCKYKRDLYARKNPLGFTRGGVSKHSSWYEVRA